jgi:hypothetical protein
MLYILCKASGMREERFEGWWERENLAEKLKGEC